MYGGEGALKLGSGRADKLRPVGVTRRDRWSTVAVRGARRDSELAARADCGRADRHCGQFHVGALGCPETTEIDDLARTAQCDEEGSGVPHESESSF